MVCDDIKTLKCIYVIINKSIIICTVVLAETGKHSSNVWNPSTSLYAIKADPMWVSVSKN